MSVRLKLAFTVFATGLVTALLVIATVLYAFRRFEHETAFRRGAAFLQRVIRTYDGLFDRYERRPAEFQGFLRSLVLFEPDTELYLLGLDGTVLVSTGRAELPPGFRVALAPVRSIIEHPDMPYVMGDDPERMDANAVIAAEPVRRVGRAGGAAVRVGYLYLVLHTQQLPEGRWDALRSSFARPALLLVIAVVGCTTALAALIIASVTRPLARLTARVSRLSERGLEETLAAADVNQAVAAAADQPVKDEFDRLGRAFDMMLSTLRRQWAALRRLDHFRREGISNLSHDLRSPLTATVACLETLDARYSAAPAPTASGDDRRLVEVALRNVRNAARLVQALGDLAQLDEPAFQLRPERVDIAELLDAIALRFTSRAAAIGVALRTAGVGSDETPPQAAVDVELFERAVANLVDNALRHVAAGGSVTLDARTAGSRVSVAVADTGTGIGADALPRLFDRFYQSRASVAPATGTGGKGLGLAIVKRIVELHGGTVAVTSTVGRGTTVVLEWPIVSTPASAAPA